MKDKALIGLDTDISSILESDEPDEIKVQKYAASLKRFKSYSAPRSIKPVIQPKKDAKYKLLFERLNQLKQKQQVKTPVGSADQRSEIDDQDKTDDTSDYNLNELFDDKNETDDNSDYSLNELFEEQAKQPLDAWEKLTESLQKSNKLQNLKKKQEKSGTIGLLRPENRLGSQQHARPGPSIKKWTRILIQSIPAVFGVWNPLPVIPELTWKRQRNG